MSTCMCVHVGRLLLVDAELNNVYIYLPVQQMNAILTLYYICIWAENQSIIEIPIDCGYVCYLRHIDTHRE